MRPDRENTTRCIAIDDEPLALDVIDKFCRRIGGVTLDTYSDPEEGMAAIRRQKPDLVFLDIELGTANGLDIASQLGSDICIIFTTAYPGYAIDGFNLDAVDYLHKPYSYSRFLTAFEKARRRIGYNIASAPRPASITVKQEYNNVNIPLSEIIYVEAMEGYSKIFRSNGVCTVSRIILKNLCALLPETDFIRIHRSYIVSLGKIDSFSRQEIRLRGGMSLPIGRQYSDAVATALRNSPKSTT